MIYIATTIIGAILLGSASGAVSSLIVLNKTIPKNKEPYLDKDMEQLLRDNGYVRLRDWRKNNV